MNRATVLLLAGTLFLAPGADAAPLTYHVGQGSKVTFDAASNLHGFHGGTEAVTGFVTWDPAAPLESQGEVTISADSLESGDRKRDSKMRGSALETSRFPSIRMSMRRFVPDAAEGPGAGNIHGELELHGVTRKLLVPATVETLADGALRVQGKVGLDMRDFGIDPPRNKILFVTLRVLPNVTVGFDLHFDPAEDPELRERLRRIEQLKSRIQSSD